MLTKKYIHLMTFCVYQDESRNEHRSWISLKPQSKSKYERDSGGYFVGDVPLYFDRSAGFDTKRSPDGYVMFVN